jgi:hypothetical protein
MGQPVVHFEVMGPEKMSEVILEIALFTDPEGHVIGLVK